MLIVVGKEEGERMSEHKTIVHFARSSWIQGDTPNKKRKKQQQHIK